MDGYEIYEINRVWRMTPLKFGFYEFWKRQQGGKRGAMPWVSS
jgi:hypothetical protein